MDPVNIEIQIQEQALNDLVKHNGGGVWPPKPLFESHWSTCLQPYAVIAHKVSERLVHINVENYSDDYNRNLINNFRQWMEEELSCLLSIDVQKALESSEVQVLQGFLS